MGTKAHTGCGREPWDSTAVTFKIFNNWDSLDCGHSIGAGLGIFQLEVIGTWGQRWRSISTLQILVGLVIQSPS